MNITPLTADSLPSAPPSSTTLTNGTTVSSGDKSLSMDDFFQLLSAEMEYQDPSDPTSNDQFMEEMAQFSTLEAMQNLESTSNYSMGTGMLGKTVAYNQTTVNSSDQEVTSMVSGTVTGVDFTTDPPQCYVSTTASDGTTSGSWIAYSSITDVYQPTSGTDSGTAT